MDCCCVDDDLGLLRHIFLSVLLRICLHSRPTTSNAVRGNNLSAVSEIMVRDILQVEEEKEEENH